MKNRFNPTNWFRASMLIGMFVVFFNAHQTFGQCTMPSVFAVTGGGSFCSGGGGVTIQLSNSQLGVSYQLRRGTTNVGAVVPGSGSLLSWTAITTAGTYTVRATTDGTSCTNTMTGNAVVTVLTLPSSFTATGASSVCPGGSTTITLPGSQTATTYQLRLNGSNIGAPITGTGAAITWPGQAGAGTYTVMATSTTNGCTRLMGGTPALTIKPLPVTFNVSGGGAFCPGTTGSTITLSGSVSGTSYQLQNGGTNIGTAKSGTGAALNWTNITSVGNLTIVATLSGCAQQMSGSATVSQLTAAGTFSVFSPTNGFYCSGSTGATINLGGSATGVNYQLKRGSTNVGPTVAGTGSPLVWTNITTAGTYTIVATLVASGCNTTMPSSVAVTAEALPTLYTISPGGSYCQGGAGIGITLPNSQTNYRYQLKLAGANVGSPIIGTTGSPLTWSGITQAGVYTIDASSFNSTCSRTMTGTATVTVNSLPSTYSTQGSQAICAGGSAVIGLNGSETGINYQLRLNGVNVGAPVPGTSAVLQWPNQSSLGNYSVFATNATTNCSRMMTASATITAATPLTPFTVTGGGTICTGGTGVEIALDGSQLATQYQLLVNGSAVGSPLTGTGYELQWPVQRTAGTYTVTATGTAPGCSLQMTGSANVMINPLPVSFALTGGGTYCTGKGITLTLSGSEQGVQYQLLKDEVAYQSPLPGTGGQLIWPDLREGGSYRVHATFTSVNCAQAMNGASIISVNSTCAKLNDLAFQYRYDGRRRMTHKKVPGAEWVYMVYDERDRLVMTQDGAQRKQNKWQYTLYDALNRPIITGLYQHSTELDQQEMSSLIANSSPFETWSGSGTDHGYTSTLLAAPKFNSANAEVLTVTYYDNYSFKTLYNNDPALEYLPNQLESQTTPTGFYPQEATWNSNVKGQVTATKTKVLGSASYLLSVIYYDEQYRAIQTISDHAKGGKDRTTTIFDFSGKVLATKTTHTLPAEPQKVVARYFDYDHAGRLLKTWHRAGGATVLLAANQYNELGQLQIKKLHNTDAPTVPDENRVFKQSIDYRYNIRGWLTNINDVAVPNSGDFFSMQLSYSTPSAVGGTAQFNGNISEIQWRNPDGRKTSYGFSYDPMNRLTEARYYDHADPTRNGRFDEKIWNTAGNKPGYDLNGNITHLTRTGLVAVSGATGNTFGTMDNLTYSYQPNSNQLLKVDDSAVKTFGFKEPAVSATDYAYDFNGNMTNDQNKDIGRITYNHLNLPERVTKTNLEYLHYTYDATGRKWKQQVFDANQAVTKTTEYVGEYVYENNSLQFINHEEGRVVKDDAGNFNVYEYHLKDHLGNVRITFTSKPTEIETGLATLEDHRKTEEASQFLYYDDAIRLNSQIFDHTHRTAGGAANTTFYSTRLTGLGTNAIYGLAKSIAVMPGDTITAEVFAKYLDVNSNNWTQALASFIASLAMGGGAPPLTLVDGGANGSIGGSTFPYTNFTRTNDNGSGPKAYLNYLLFDGDRKPIGQGFRRLSAAAREFGQNAPHERLAIEGSEAIAIKEAGYVYIWLSNENDTPVEVYFDDFKVTHAKSPIVQNDNYYPFGLTFNSHSRENSVKNQYRYSGKEEENELGIGWINYGTRMYSKDIGRWITVDSYSESYFSFTPYNYVRNNPVLRIDPTGEWDITVHLHNDREQYGYGIAVVTDRKGKEVFRFVVRAEGSGGRDRHIKNSDTPLGVYDIPDKEDAWRESTNDNRDAYGPNPRLVMNKESGEIVDTNRDAIRIHGGRQEIYNQETGEWVPVDNPSLKKTNGCLRVFDSDAKKLKDITDGLMANDNKEFGGKVRVLGDFNQFLKDDGKEEKKQNEETKTFWQGLMNSMSNGLDALQQWLKTSGF